MTEADGMRLLVFQCWPEEPSRRTNWKSPGREMEWRVPPGVTAATVEAIGAQGRDARVHGLRLGQGGVGARVRGLFALVPGTVLRLTVGNTGSADSWDGGGSWVLAADGSPLLVAGGGGSIAFKVPSPCSVSSAACSSKAR